MSPLPPPPPPARLTLEITGPPGPRFKELVREIQTMLALRGYPIEPAECITRDEKGAAAHVVVLVCSSHDLASGPASSARPD